MNSVEKENEKWKLLLVDDEEDIREVLFIALSDTGYDVATAENGDTALRLFKKLSPSIVMTDIKMPGMDGIELLQKIKRENPETEVIMITGHGDMDLAVKSLKFDAADFITKPIDVNAMKVALKRVHDKIVIKRKLKEYTESLEALIQEKIELQDRLASLGLMIGSISHCIKGWLTNLDAGIYMLDSGFSKKQQEMSEEGLDIVKLAVERIKKLVLDILFYAKERKLQRSEVNMIDFSNDIADAIDTKIRKRSIQIVRDFDNSPETFVIDAEFLRTALINILDNAIDACLEDQSKTEHHIVFSVKQDSLGLVIEIRDDGIGMNSKTRDKIFDLFFSSKETKGTGFGLFITRNIIAQHDGSIHVTSAEGRGSKFIVKIPKPKHLL